ncbi:MAG: hypothetical protein ACK5MY_03265 [Jhaorihella sp.]
MISLGRNRTAAKPLLWLHIGHGKTGTTALQHYFVARTRTDPAFHYPETGRLPSGAHHALFPLETQAKALKEAPALLKVLCAGLRADGMTVLSSEHMCYFRPRQVAQVARALKGCEVRILYFARRQDELMESAFKWSQIASPGQFPDLERFVETQTAGFDLMRRLEAWREAFGDDAIHVRLYHRETCGRNIVGAANSVMGLSPIDMSGEPATRRDSLGTTMTRVLMAYDALHDKPGKRHAFLQDLRRIEAQSGKDRAALFSLPLRQRIMARYAESNAVFAQTFLTAPEAEILLRPVSD